MPNTSRKNKLSFLQTIDAFNKPIKLYFEGDTKHKTKFGGLITLIFIVVLSIMLISAFIQLINRSEVNITTQIDHIIHSPKMKLKKNDFRFVIAPLNVQLNYSLFSYTASITNYINSTPILLKPCLQKDFNDFEEEFIKFGLNEGICSAFDEIDIQGNYGDDNFSFLELLVVQCINGTTQSNEIQFYDIGKIFVSKTDQNRSVTQIEFEKNDISENYQDNEKETSTDIILNPIAKDNINFSQKRKIFF